VALVLVLVAVGGWAGWRHARLQAEQQALQARVAELNEQVNALRARIEASRSDPGLVRQAEQLEQVVQRKRSILDLILDEGLGNTHGFSAQLRALARNDTPELWLEHIRFEQGGRSVRLDGRTLAPEALPDYIHRLTEATPFSGLAFNYLVVSRGEDEDEAGRAALDGHHWQLATEAPKMQEARR